MLPNCVQPIEVYLAALQGGWYYVPINYRLSAPEIAYILADSGGEGVRRPRALRRRRAAAAAEEAGIAPEAPGSRVGSIPGWVDHDELRRHRSRTDRPDDLAAGAAMHYTSGTTGKPKGVRAQA